MAIFKATVNMVQGGEEMANVLGFVTEDSLPATLQTITQVIFDAYETHLIPLMTNDCQIDSVTWYDQAAPLGAPGIIQVGSQGALTGAGLSDPLPRQVAGLVSYVTASGPPYRGRTYIAGLDEGCNDAAGTPEDGTLAGMAAWADAIRTNVAALPGVNRFAVVRGRTAANPTALAASIQTISTVNKWFTQRRRNNTG